MSNAHGYRGYIGSRPYHGIDFPQNVQNFLIRSYCQKHAMTYLLSATEYRMTGCYMILEEVIASIDALEGVVLFTIFMLPESKQRRYHIYESILNAGRSLHAALEDIAIRKWEDVDLVEDILQLNKIALTDNVLPELQDFVAVRTS
jgi:sporadic carbohydrate cluster protein (TIGR04323 family)